MPSRRRAEGGASDRARRIRLDRVRRTYGMHRSGRLRRFFRRAGAWLALFHCFAATDMHQENMIAAGDHPVPIDLEMILQAPPRNQTRSRGAGFEAAMETIANSVMTVGLLPAYGRSPDNKIFAIGGMTSDWNSKTKLRWSDINSDKMRPAKPRKPARPIPNLPHVDGRYARFGDHIDDLIAGFEDYAKFLLLQTSDANRAACSTALPDCRSARSFVPRDSTTCCSSV